MDSAAKTLGARGGKAAAERMTAEQRSARATTAAAAAAAKLTPAERSERGRAAVAARWAKRANNSCVNP